MAGPFSSDFSADFGFLANASVIATQAAQTVSAHAAIAVKGVAVFTQTSQAIAAAGTIPIPILGTLAGAQSQTLHGTAVAVPLPDTAILSKIQGGNILSASAVADLNFHTASLAAIQSPQLLSSPAIPTPTPTPVVISVVTGSQADMLARLKAVLPLGWFPDSDTPVLDGLLSGIGSIWSFLWSLLIYVAQQRRIATATDINLDIISTDFLGQTLPRKSGEADAAFSARIRSSIFQEMGTRKAVSDALTLLNGATPTIFEPANANDTGGYGAAGTVVNTGLYYNTMGGWGSYNLPFQAFIQTNAPDTATVVGVQGYGSMSGNPVVIGGYGVGAIEYSPGVIGLLSASDEEVYNAINAVKPVATIMWVSTEGTALQPSTGDAVLDSNFILDVSRLS